MAKVRISKKDGTPTAYFWSDKDTNEATNRTVYKKTIDGVKRMKGVRYNTLTSRMRRHT